MCLFWVFFLLSVTFFLFVSFPGRLIRAKRIVEAANPTEYEYIEGNIPMEWDGESGPQHHSCRMLAITNVLARYTKCCTNNAE